MPVAVPDKSVRIAALGEFDPDLPHAGRAGVGPPRRIGADDVSAFHPDIECRGRTGFHGKIQFALRVVEGRKVIFDRRGEGRAEPAQAGRSEAQAVCALVWVLCCGNQRLGVAPDIELAVNAQRIFAAVLVGGCFGEDAETAARRLRPGHTRLPPYIVDRQHRPGPAGPCEREDLLGGIEVAVRIPVQRNGHRVPSAVTRESKIGRFVPDGHPGQAAARTLDTDADIFGHRRVDIKVQESVGIVLHVAEVRQKDACTKPPNRTDIERPDLGSFGRRLRCRCCGHGAFPDIQGGFVTVGPVRIGVVAVNQRVVDGCRFGENPKSTGFRGIFTQVDFRVGVVFQTDPVHPHLGT